MNEDQQKRIIKIIVREESKCQNKLEKEFIQEVKQVIEGFSGKIKEEQIRGIDKYFSPRLCSDPYVWEIGDIPEEKKIMIMILESPHKDEYYKEDEKDENGNIIKHKGDPIRPAMGTTGRLLREHFLKIFGKNYENYHLVLMNAIPFQCSLGATPPDSIRDAVFAKVWKNERIGKPFFLNRLGALLKELNKKKKNVVIVNACTNDKKTFRREKVTKAITELVREKNIYCTAHPSSWMGHQYFEEI